jgi:hypothetical protein
METVLRRQALHPLMLAVSDKKGNGLEFWIFVMWARHSDCIMGVCVELLCDACKNDVTESEPSKRMQKSGTGIFYNRRYTPSASLNVLVSKSNFLCFLQFNQP